MNKTWFKEKYLVFPTFLIPIFKKYNMTMDEALLLSYFWNNQEEEFDIQKIHQVLKLTEEEVLNAFNSLIKKQIVTVTTGKDTSNKRMEIVDLDLLYQEMYIDLEEQEKEKNHTEIYSVFEREFARTISPMEYEIINAWLEKGFSEELILGALKEAIYNGVTSLRYIDKILYEWQKKGYKTMKDVQPLRMESKTKNVPDLVEWDWLEENEK